MKMKLTFFAIAFLLCSFIGTAYSFDIPERLEFDLKWTGVKAGTSILEIKREGDNVIITSTARSADWITTFYPVDDRIESIHHKDYPNIPVQYSLKLIEGKSRKNKTVSFDRVKKKALYIDIIKSERIEYDVPDGVLDTISAFYIVRTLDLQVGHSVFVPVFDSKKLYDVEIKVLRKEKIVVPAGEFSTIVIQPMLKSEGIFQSKGDIFIYLTDDARRMPVLVKSKVAVGSINAVLVKVSH